MDDPVIVAIISAIATIVTVIAQNNKTNLLLEERMKQTNIRLEERDKSMKEELTKLANKVEAHNSFGLQLAKLETRVDTLEHKS